MQQCRQSFTSLLQLLFIFLEQLKLCGDLSNCIRFAPVSSGPSVAKLPQFSATQNVENIFSSPVERSVLLCMTSLELPL